MQRTVLVIDDDPAFLRFIQLHLTKEGFEVITASTGKEGMDVLKRRPVELLMTDMRMPLLDGYDIVYAMKEMYADVPILLTTAHDVNERVKRALSYESVVLLRKPFEADQLTQAVTAIFANRAHPHIQAA